MDEVDLKARLLALEYVAAQLLAQHNDRAKLEEALYAAEDAASILEPGVRLHPAATVGVLGTASFCAALVGIIKMAIERQEAEEDARHAADH